MADESNTDDDQDSDIVENVIELKCSYKSEIKPRYYLIHPIRSSPLNERLKYFPRLNSINKKSKEERDSLIQLNENFSKYLQTIRFLEIENKKLILMIETIENSIKSSSPIENIYQIEISQANQILHRLENENEINIEQRFIEIENENTLCQEMNKFHEINQNEIDSIRKTISKNESNLQIEKNLIEDQINSTLLTHQIEINELRAKYFSIDIKPSFHFQNEIYQSIQQSNEEYRIFIENTKNILHNQFIIQQKQIKKNKEKSNKLNRYIKKINHRNRDLKNENEKLNQQIQYFQNLIENLNEKNNQKTNEHLKQIEQIKTNFDELNFAYNQITTIHISLETEINTYRQLLEGRRGLQFHIDRIITQINNNSNSNYFQKISKKNLSMKHFKDFVSVIFIDGSGSTSDQLKCVSKSIFDIEINISKMIKFNYIIVWNINAMICEDISLFKPNGLTDPSCIFTNQLTKDIFNQSDIIFFITDGQIEHQNLSKFSSNVKNNLNKVLIVCIIIDENIKDYSSVNVSVIAPLIFAPNVLCLLFNGQIFSVILSKGSISSIYSISQRFIDFNLIFNQMKFYEKISIPNDILILNDNFNELIYLDFMKFIHLTDLDQMIFIDKNQWKLIIQYAKINNQIDQLSHFVSTMKIYSNYSDLNRIIKQFDRHYFNKEKILILKQNSSQENSKLINQLQQQLNQINQDKTNYINQNLHLTPQYWNQIRDLIYQQQISSYFIKHFYFD